jgi:hypothetical protein
MRHELFAGAVILDRPYLPTDDNPARANKPKLAESQESQPD